MSGSCSSQAGSLRHVIAIFAAVFLFAAECQAQICLIDITGVCKNKTCAASGVPHYVGSGVAIDQAEDGDAIVVTSAHLFDDAFSSISVNGMDATLLGRIHSQTQDVAFVRVDGQIKTLNLGGDPCPGKSGYTA